MYGVTPTLFHKHTSIGNILQAIYDDDILVIRSDTASIAHVKAYSQKHLTIQELVTPKFFMGIEFAYQLGKLVLNQCKYVPNISMTQDYWAVNPGHPLIDNKSSL